MEQVLSEQLVAARTNTMQAVVYGSYGPIEALQLREIARPTPRADEVLVRVQAAALHIGDVFGVRGQPYLMRVVTGLLRPKYGIPGFDVCGVVESVGAEVTRFKVGERVFGAGFGTCAELVSVKAETLAHAPERLSAAQAAGLATSGIAALVALRDVAKLEPGSKLLINGAAGGIGTFAIQIAKSMGAEVTAVCSSQRRALMFELGADHVIDYNEVDFTRADERYDVIFDNVENHTLEECRRALTPRGMLILNSGVGEDGLALWVRLLKPLVLSPLSQQTYRRFLTMPKLQELEALASLVTSGTLTPVVGKTFPLAETARALAYIANGHALGKTAIEVTSSPTRA
ncbi:MAG TPA: NAD(P)-dependent alcohol dehydrogenase [Polyangiales bacterium]|nr:NAD(P)-dependent alcohol dehydrogenase [Polyangiales bacterium]